MYVFIHFCLFVLSLLNLDQGCYYICVCVCVRVCVCVWGGGGGINIPHVYVVYEDTNLYNDMGMTGITRRR